MTIIAILTPKQLDLSQPVTFYFKENFFPFVFQFRSDCRLENSAWLGTLPFFFQWEIVPSRSLYQAFTKVITRILLFFWLFNYFLVNFNLSHKMRNFAATQSNRYSTFQFGMENKNENSQTNERNVILVHDMNFILLVMVLNALNRHRSKQGMCQVCYATTLLCVYFRRLALFPFPTITQTS